jgi:hypothetical protein
MTFLDCPAYVDRDGTVRCGLPAEVRCQFPMRSSDGPVESAMIRCPAGHWFTGAIESLTWNSKDPGTAADAAAGHGSLPRTHDVRDSNGRATRHELPAGPGQPVRRPNGAPAYYQGRPAQLWITAMSRSRTARARRARHGQHAAPAIGGAVKQPPHLGHLSAPPRKTHTQGIPRPLLPSTPRTPCRCEPQPAAQATVQIVPCRFTPPG